MPLVGESNNSPWASNQRGDLYTGTWEINIPPSHAMVKVCITGFQEYGAEFGSPGEIIATAGLISARRRKADGSDEQINFPPIFGPDAYVWYYDDNLTNVNYGLVVRSAFARLLFNLEYWA